MSNVTIVKLLTDKGTYDVMESLKKVQTKVSEWGIQSFKRWDIESQYKGQDCVDKQSVILDLSKVDVYGYTLHKIEYNLD